MASGPISWLFELFDHMSGPAKRISDSLHGSETSLRDFGAELSRVNEKLARIEAHPDQFKAWRQGQKDLSDKMRVGKGDTEGFRHKLFETLVIAKELGDVIYRTGERVYEFGKEMISAAGFSERVHLALTAVAGGTKEASDIMERFERVSAKTAMTSHEFTSMGTELLTRGFNRNEMPQAIGASLDIEAMNPTRPGTGNEFIGLITGMKEMGKFTERTMRSLKEMGISIPDVTQALASQYGVKTDAVKKLISTGKIDADHGLNAIYKAITKKTGGPLGSLGEKAGGTVDALLHKLKALPETLFEGFSKTRGYEKFRGFLQKLWNELQPGSPFYEKVSQAVSGVIDQITKLFDGHDVFESIKGAITTGIGLAGDFVSYLKQVPVVLDKIVTAAEVLGAIWAGGKIIGGISLVASALPGLGVVFGGFAGVLGAVTLPVAAAAAAFVAMAAAIVAVIKAARELGGMDRVWKDFKDWVGGEKPAVAKDNPFREKYGYGQLPHRASGGSVSAGMPYVVGENRPELFVPNQSGRIVSSVPSHSGGRGVSISIGDIVVGQVGDSGADEISQRVAQEIRTHLRREIPAIAEELAIEMGVS